jgi:8-oxo-dGTP diphosphatase
MKKIEVVAGILLNDKHEILCAQRSSTGELANYWEFPGGKVDSSETHEETLVRELEEELNITVQNYTKFMTVEYSYPDFDLILHTYIVDKFYGDISLNFHQSIQWIAASALYHLDWAPADWPIVKRLQNEIFTQTD